MQISGHQLRVVVIGTGSAGSRHLRALKGLPGMEAVAMPTRPERRADWVAAGYDVCGSVEEACAGGASWAVIATETGRHEQDAVAALKAGMDVLVEKPLAANCEEGARIVAAAAKAGRELRVGTVLRQSSSLQKLREWLPRVGRAHHVRVECQSYLPAWRPERDPASTYSARLGEGGVLLDLVHEIDYMGWLLGWPDRVGGSVGNLGRLGIQSEEWADLQWRLPSGGTASLRLDYLTRPSRRSMSVFGEEGTLVWYAVAGEVEWRPGSSTGGERWVRAESADELFSRQAEGLTGGWRTAGAAPATGREGLWALAVCDAARRASAEGRMMGVSYD